MSNCIIDIFEYLFSGQYYVKHGYKLGMVLFMI